MMIIQLQMTVLCGHLDNIWNENGSGSVILFAWMQFLTDEVIPILGIKSPFKIEPLSKSRQAAKSSENKGDSTPNPSMLDSRAFQDIASIGNLAQVLIEYDSCEQTRLFDVTYFECNVCFLEKPGAKCTAFYPCSHIYCCECMAEYFRIQVNDGAVKSLTCPYGKCESQANPTQVRLLVDADVYERYEQFLLQTTLDCMGDVIYCPRKVCQSPVIVEEDTSMGMCPRCSFAFCKICKRSFHGVSACPISESEYKEIRRKYITASEEEKKLMEKKYGKKTLKYALEEAVSEQWIESNSKKCPYCKASIQKIDGCNKMSCFKCHSNFCWLCAAKISKSQPYTHFNNPSSKCFNKLFLGVTDIVDDEFEDFEDDDFWF